MRDPRLGLLIACACMAAAVALIFSASGAGGAEQKLYVGAESCASCHEEQYKSYVRNSSKAHSWRSIEKMRAKLSRAEQEECYACHTTGYGKPGGFVSLDLTPRMANVGCESCHGPGSAHAESGDPGDIARTPDLQGCLACHNAERIRNFKFKPMLYHGGH